VSVDAAHPISGFDPRTTQLDDLKTASAKFGPWLDRRDNRGSSLARVPGKTLAVRPIYIGGFTELTTRKIPKIIPFRSGFAWKMERVGGPEFGHVTQGLARLFFVDACVF
jgi:hypothetical protein